MQDSSSTVQGYRIIRIYRHDFTAEELIRRILLSHRDADLSPQKNSKKGGSV